MMETEQINTDNNFSLKVVDLLQKCSIQDDVSSSQMANSAEAHERGERNILAGISKRTRTLNYWLEELHAEQERSVEEVTQLKKSRNILQKVFRHTNLPLSVAQACKRYRTRRVTNQQEVIDQQLDQEVAFLQAQQEKMTKFEEEMQSLQSKIENMELELRNCVLKKVDNLLVSQDCSRRDTSFRRNDNQSVTLGETVNPQEWENNVSRILSAAEGVRESSSSLRQRVESHVVSYNKEIVALWERSNTEFARIVELEQSTKTKLELLLSKVLYRLAKMTGQEQHLRTQIDIHQVPLDVASVRKHKMQTIPPNENSSDLFWQSLQNEEQNAKERKNTLEEEHRKTEAHTSELHEMRRSVEVKLDTVNKNLFIDRECCISLRKGVPVYLKL